uniref:Integrase core domain containing protein n=1 Tax=Solanum tuberosum TaxID=4113 RepID=M1DP98_SOLTU
MEMDLWRTTEWISDKDPDRLKLQKSNGEEATVMARPKVHRRNQPPRKRVRGIVINEGAKPTRTTQANLPPKGGKGKGKKPVVPTPAEQSSDSMGIYATHLTTSVSEGNSGDRLPNSVSEPEDYQTL